MKYTQTQPDIPVIFEDDQLLVIDKPANLLSQKDHTGDPDVLTLCKEYLAQHSEGKHTPYVGLIHRLDRPVSGLMLLAKTGPAAKSLSKQIRDRTIQKTYWTVTEGNPTSNGMLTHYLLKDRDRNVVEVTSPRRRKAKKAVLSFATIAREKGLHLLSVHLQTGRPHQIRVQLAYEGYPVWGDYKYGSDQPDGRNIALRAAELVLDHPATGQQLQIELPVPSEQPWSRFSITPS